MTNPPNNTSINENNGNIKNLQDSNNINANKIPNNANASENNNPSTQQINGNNPMSNFVETPIGIPGLFYIGISYNPMFNDILKFVSYVYPSVKVQSSNNNSNSQNKENVNQSNINDNNNTNKNPGSNLSNTNNTNNHYNNSHFISDNTLYEDKKELKQIRYRDHKIYDV